MISGSNEQLQQESEFTLLKPDCHGWWISKMQSGREDTLEERYAIKICFKLGKNDATETYGMLQTAFGASCMNQASVFEWHKRFKKRKESVRDDERCGRSKEVNTPELIGQRVSVTMLIFKGSSGRDSYGRGQESSNWVSGISTRTMQGLDCREAEELSRCPSCSNSLWQGWGCGLVHWPGGNTTNPIWRVLASSDGISSWTPLKPQHIIPCWLSVQW